jgi:hypothetical protein
MKFGLNLLTVKVLVCKDNDTKRYQLYYKKTLSMKTFTLKTSFFLCVFALLFTAFSTSSCKKDKTCHGKVHVIDTINGGTPVANANVKFDAQSVNGDVVYNGVTDGGGDATIDVKLPAIFDVTVTKGTKHGTGVIRLDEPGKDAEVTVTIQ